MVSKTWWTSYIRRPVRSSARFSLMVDSGLFFLSFEATATFISGASVDRHRLAAVDGLGLRLCLTRAGFDPECTTLPACDTAWRFTAELGRDCLYSYASIASYYLETLVEDCASLRTLPASSILTTQQPRCQIRRPCESQEYVQPLHGCRVARLTMNRRLHRSRRVVTSVSIYVLTATFLLTDMC